MRPWPPSRLRSSHGCARFVRVDEKFRLGRGDNMCVIRGNMERETGLLAARERCTPATDHGAEIRQRPLCGSDTDQRLTGETSMGRRHYRAEGRGRPLLWRGVGVSAPPGSGGQGADTPCRVTAGARGRNNAHVIAMRRTRDATIPMAEHEVGHRQQQRPASPAVGAAEGNRQEVPAQSPGTSRHHDSCCGPGGASLTAARANLRITEVHVDEEAGLGTITITCCRFCGGFYHGGRLAPRGSTSVPRARR